MSDDLTPREVARTRLLAQAKGVKASELLPNSTGRLNTDPETLIALATEFEAVAVALLAIMHEEGMDMQGALQLAFMVLDRQRS